MLRYNYQNELYKLMREHNRFCMVSPRAFGKSTIQRNIICKVLENRLNSPNRREFEITERNFHIYLVSNCNVFICNQKEYNDVLEELLTKLKVKEKTI